MSYLFLHRWHRRAGIISALLVLLLALTGLLLNHSDKLKLDQRYVHSEMLLDWYNIHPPAAPIGFNLGDIWVTRIGDRLYFNDKELKSRSQVLSGIALQPGMVVLALADKLLLLTRDGRQIEKLSGYDGVPAGMTAIGTNEYGELVIRGTHGDYLVDLDALAWDNYEEIAATWSVKNELPAALKQTLLNLYRGKGLSWEHLLLDLHSGRLWGNVGVYVVDLGALLFMVLALSGSWMWWRRKQ